jgi:hypothetical protein
VDERSVIRYAKAPGGVGIIDQVTGDGPLRTRRQHHCRIIEGAIADPHMAKTR